MMNNEGSDEPANHGTRARCRAGSLWGDLNETKKIVEAMSEAERRARNEKTQTLRSLRLAQTASNKPGEPKEP